MTPLTLLQVAFGGAIGASCRFLTGHALLRLLGSSFPYGTFAVNVIGSFLMGVIVVLLGHFSANRFAPLLVTGFLGGFTTFSSFSLDVATLYDRGQTGLAAAYVLSSVTLSVAALFAAMALTRGALQ